MKNSFFKALVLLVCCVLSACGGGSSSSGSSISFEVGVYVGTQTVTFSAPGLAPDTETFQFRMSVSEDTITIIDPDFTSTAPISRSGSFMASSGFLDFSRPDGVPCNIFLKLDYSGQVTGSTASGNVSGGATCRGLPDINASGTFSASLNSTAKASNDSIKTGISNYIAQ